MQRIAFKMGLFTAALFFMMAGSAALAAGHDKTANHQDELNAQVESNAHDQATTQDEITTNDQKTSGKNNRTTGCNPATGEGCETKSAVPVVYDGKVLPN